MRKLIRRIPEAGQINDSIIGFKWNGSKIYKRLTIFFCPTKHHMFGWTFSYDKLK